MLSHGTSSRIPIFSLQSFFRLILTYCLHKWFARLSVINVTKMTFNKWLVSLSLAASRHPLFLFSRKFFCLSQTPQRILPSSRTIRSFASSIFSYFRSRLTRSEAKAFLVHLERFFDHPFDRALSFLLQTGTSFLSSLLFLYSSAFIVEFALHTQCSCSDLPFSHQGTLLTHRDSPLNYDFVI